MTDLLSFHATTPPKANWFSDLRFTPHGIIVRKTGRVIGLADLTPGEVGKFLSYFIVVLAQGLRARLQRKTRYSVWFAPDRPRPWYVVWSAATLAAVDFATHEAAADVVFYFEDVTVGDPPSRMAINGGCANISKTRVAQIFARAAGYPLAIDPLMHAGRAVEKSEENGAHDGRLVDCPVSPRPGACYQHFIDSSDGVTAFDFRTTIINRKPRFVLVKGKPVADRFSIHNDTVVFQTIEDVFSADEIALITRFCEAMQMDWGALDILRDRTSRRIYIVDANKTDTGPAVDLSWADREKLKKAIASAFLRMIEERAAR